MRDETERASESNASDPVDKVVVLILNSNIMMMFMLAG
jgi:hypothetical protein